MNRGLHRSGAFEQPVATSYGGREEYADLGLSGANCELRLAGNMLVVTLSANCTFTFPSVANDGVYSFTLVAVQDGTGSRTATWPSSVKWSGGTAPTLTTTAAKRDVFAFVTYDGGATWLGFTSGLNFA